MYKTDRRKRHGAAEPNRRLRNGCRVGIAHLRAVCESVLVSIAHPTVLIPGLFSLLWLTAAFAADQPNVAVLLRSADAPRQTFLHSVVRVRATVEQPEQPPQTGEFDLYLGNDDQQLVVFRDKKNKGRKFLMVGDKAWLIVPGSKHPIPVTASQRMMGASSFADMARVRLASDYTGTLQPGMEPCGEPAQPCRVVEIKAAAKSAPYASGMLWIDGAGLLRKAIYRLASGKPAKEIVYRYKEDTAGEMIPAGLTLTDLLLPDQAGRTTLDYLDRRAAELPASMFDPQRQVTR